MQLEITHHIIWEGEDEAFSLLRHRRKSSDLFSLFHYALFTPPLFTEVTDVCFHKVTIITFTVHHARLQHSSHGRKLSHLNFSLVGPHGGTIGGGSRYVMRAPSREVATRPLSPLTQAETKSWSICCVWSTRVHSSLIKIPSFLILSPKQETKYIIFFFVQQNTEREGKFSIFTLFLCLLFFFSNLNTARAQCSVVKAMAAHSHSPKKKETLFTLVPSQTRDDDDDDRPCILVSAATHLSIEHFLHLWKTLKSNSTKEKSFSFFTIESFFLENITIFPLFFFAYFSTLLTHKHTHKKEESRLGGSKLLALYYAPNDWKLSTKQFEVAQYKWQKRRLNF